MNTPSHHVTIRVARDQDLFEQIGRDLYFDLVDHGKVRSFHVQGKTPFSLFKKEVAQQFGIPVQLQRFWKWSERQNHTYRPDEPLTPQQESKPVGELKELLHNKKTELNLFLEVELGPDRRPVAPPVKTNEDILLFFKLYDPEREQLRYVGRLFVKRHAKPNDVLGKLNEMAGFSPCEGVDLYEEVNFKPSLMCVLIDGARSFQANRLGDGGIICFQKNMDRSWIKCRYPTVLPFFEHKRACQGAEAQNHPSHRQKTDRFISRLNRLDELIHAENNSACLEVASSSTQTPHTVPTCPPSSEEVESAKQSLRECISHLFGLNNGKGLASALSTLRKAEAGVSPKQKEIVAELWDHFEDFISGYFTYRRDTCLYELLKLKNSELLSAMEKDLEMRLSCKGKLEELSEEEEELKQKLEEVQKQLGETRCRKSKLISDWEALTTESVEIESKYLSTMRKLAEAEELKRIAEERMPPGSKNAWSLLQAQFR